MNFRRSVIIAELWWPELARRYKFSKMFAFFGKTTFCGEIFAILFRKFSSRHDRRVVFKFREILLRRNRWNRALLAWQKKQNLPGYPAVATRRIAPKICQGQCPKMCSECSRFHPNRFTLSRVTAECVNTAKRRRKVNPIFGGGLSSSRIIKQNDRSHHRHRWYLTTNFKCRTHIVFNTNIITIEELLSSQATTVCKISTLSEHIVYVYKRRWSSLLALYSVYCLFPKRETYLFHKSYPT